MNDFCNVVAPAAAPRVATRIEDFEIGQRVHWHTDDYTRSRRHCRSGVIAPCRHSSIRFEIQYDPAPGEYCLGWDRVDGNLHRGVWTILEEAPPAEPDPVTLVESGKVRLSAALAALDGRRAKNYEGPLGLRALEDVVNAARMLVRRIDEADL